MVVARTVVDGLSLARRGEVRGGRRVVTVISMVLYMRRVRTDGRRDVGQRRRQQQH